MYWRVSQKFILISNKKLINAYIYIYIGLGLLKSLIFLNSFLHEVLGCAPIIILIVFFCKVNIFLLYVEFSQRIIPQFAMEWK